MTITLLSVLLPSWLKKNRIWTRIRKGAQDRQVILFPSRVRFWGKLPKGISFLVSSLSSFHRNIHWQDVGNQVISAVGIALKRLLMPPSVLGPGHDAYLSRLARSFPWVFPKPPAEAHRLLEKAGLVPGLAAVCADLHLAYRGVARPGCPVNAILAVGFHNFLGRGAGDLGLDLEFGD